MSQIKITLEKKHIVNDVSAECNLLGRTIEISGKATDGGVALQELAGFIKSVSDDETKPVVARAMSEAYARVKEACQRFLVYGRDVDDNRLESMFVYADSQDVNSGLFYAADLGTPAKYVTNGDVSTSIKLGRVALEKGGCYKLTIPLSRAIYESGSGVFHLYIGDKLHEVSSFCITGSEDVVAYFTADETAVKDVILQLEWITITDPSGDVVGVECPKFLGGTLTVTCSKRKFGNYVLDLNIENFDEGVTSSVTAYAHRLIVDYVIAAILKNQRAEDFAKYYASSEKAYDSLVRILQARKTFGRQAHDWQ